MQGNNKRSWQLPSKRALLMPVVFYTSLLAVCFSISSINAGDRRESEDLANRFVKDAAPQWEEYRQFARHLQGSVTHRTSKGANLVSHLRWEVKQNSRCRMLLEQQLKKGNSRGGSFVYNPLYAFSVKRREESTLWALTNVQLRDDADDNLSLVRNTDEQLCITYYPIRLYSIDLSSLCAEPTFRVKRAKQVLRDGAELAEIEFDNKHPLKHERGKRLCPVQNGILLLDPDHCWVMRSCDVNCQYVDAAAKITIRVDYRDSSGKYLLPKQWLAKRELIKNEHSIETSIVDFDLSEPSQPPRDTEFTLPAFGIPEPNFIHKPKPWYLWTALAGFVCLGFAAFFRWLTRRPKRQTD